MDDEPVYVTTTVNKHIVKKGDIRVWRYSNVRWRHEGMTIFKCQMKTWGYDYIQMSDEDENDRQKKVTWGYDDIQMSDEDQNDGQKNKIKVTIVKRFILLLARV